MPDLPEPTARASCADLIALLRTNAQRSITYYSGKTAHEVSFGQLHRQVNDAIAVLQDYGVAAGDRVGVVAANGQAALLIDLALLGAHCTVVQLPERAVAATLAMVGPDNLDYLIVESDSHDSGAMAQFEPAGQVAGLALYGRAGLCTQPASPKLMGAPALIFSSGTSGKIKQIVVNPVGVLHNATVFFSAFAPRPDDRFMIFLPLSNYQQKLLIYGCILYGISICLTDTRHVMAALRNCPSTLFLAPPIFYESAWQLAGAGAADAAHKATSLRAFFGGAMRIMWSGMAPIAPAILEDYKCAQVPLYEAYGMTEYGPISSNLPGRNVIGSVGRPLAEGSVQISEAGEIILRPDTALTTGYLAEHPDDERAVYTEEGAIATGDLGYFDDQGYLFIQGRKKELLITSAGYKIHPQSVEQAFRDLDFVLHAVLMGNGKPYLGLLLIVVALDDALRARVNARVARLNADECKLFPIKRLLIRTGNFTCENGMLTRNMKLNRTAIARTYEQELFC
ncbi:AMP-binding protein [Massilia sp. PAMC28688]|uniref:AMP-binding protein n=1 Tax=Massilia sp. PAMC28688 TaxID=2861283 RepID=UPI001C62B11E|nr:AMP-binding protein [Massilia sp. PAMC28688]QYF92630.1 AMP-binding protein [Massilia sp. PAMC28688]